MESILQNLTIYDIRVCCDVYTPAGTRRNKNNRVCHGLIFSTTGKIDYYHNGNIYSTDSDHFILVPQGATYYLIGDKEDVSHVLNFNCNLNLSNFMRFEITNRSILRDAENVVEVCSEKAPGWQLKVKSLIYSILGKTLNGATEQNFPKHINVCLSYINSNYGDPELNNATIAKSAQISAVYMQKEFIKYIGIPPQKYLQKIRLTTAAELLISRNYSVTEIAQKTGYASVYHFSRIFKQAYGMSPMEYRNISRAQM